MSLSINLSITMELVEKEPRKRIKEAKQIVDEVLSMSSEAGHKLSLIPIKKNKPKLTQFLGNVKFDDQEEAQ